MRNDLLTAAVLAFLLAAPMSLSAAEKGSAAGKRPVRLDPPAQRLSRLAKAVELSTEQEADIQGILEEMDRNVRKAVDAGNARIREGLEEDQKEAFDAFVREEAKAASAAEKPRAAETRKRLVPMSEWESEDNSRKKGGQGGQGQGGQGGMEGGEDGGQGGGMGQGGGQGGMRGGQGGMGQGGMRGGQGGMGQGGGMRGGQGGMGQGGMGQGGGMRGGQGGMGQGGGMRGGPGGMGQGGMGPKNKKCGDGVCDEVEQSRGVCPQDCN